jgi:cytochrome c nitrite reductase small subunit
MRNILLLRFVPVRWRLPIYVMLGLLVGLALATFRVSEAAAYLSDDPRACINCHIMRPEYTSWQHSSHARTASCNDCHVPHTSQFAKYAYKARDGSRHSFMFTFRLEPQVIKASPSAEKVIEANCKRCHEAQLSRAHLLLSSGRRCIDCHRELPHGTVHSLSSTPGELSPRLEPVHEAPLKGGYKNE